MKHFTRLSLGFAAFALVAGSAFALGSKVFPDVQKGSYYENAVMNLSEQGVVSGYPNGNFGPSDSVNRADLATILNRYDEKVVAPLKWQLALYHQKGLNELRGASWATYEKEFGYYPLSFDGGREGGPNYDENIDYINTVPEGWTEVYNNVGTGVNANTNTGIKIVAMGDYKNTNESAFIIVEFNDFSGESVHGFFYDDVNSLVAELKK